MRYSRFILPLLLLCPAFAAPFYVATVAAKPAVKNVATASKASLYLFVSPDCPIANRYATRYAELQRDYVARGVALTLVYSGGEPAFTDADFAKWARERKLEAVARVRASHEAALPRLAAAYGSDTTGTAALALVETTFGLADLSPAGSPKPSGDGPSSGGRRTGTRPST